MTILGISGEISRLHIIEQGDYEKGEEKKQVRY